MENNYGLPDAFFAIFGMQSRKTRGFVMSDKNEWPNTIEVQGRTYELLRPLREEEHNGEVCAWYQPQGPAFSDGPPNVWRSISGRIEEI